jgi:hypothetical protein
MSEAHYNLGLLYLFSKTPPGGLKPPQAIDKAIAHLERYKEMRKRSSGTTGDDVDDLITRAKNKKSILEAMATQAAAPPPPPQPAAAPASGDPPPPPPPGDGASTGALPPP